MYNESKELLTLKDIGQIHKSNVKFIPSSSATQINIIFRAKNGQTIFTFDMVEDMMRFVQEAVDDPLWSKLCYKSEEPLYIADQYGCSD